MNSDWCTQDIDIRVKRNSVDWPCFRPEYWLCCHWCPAEHCCFSRNLLTMCDWKVYHSFVEAFHLALSLATSIQPTSHPISPILIWTLHAQVSLMPFPNVFQPKCSMHFTFPRCVTTLTGNVAELIMKGLTVVSTIGLFLFIGDLNCS
jgi:hypothetical protein